MGEPETTPGDTVPHEYIDLEMTVDGLDTPADEQKLRDVLNELKGIRSMALAKGKLRIEYEPLHVTKAEILEIIARAGYRAGSVESGAASAIGDAVRERAPENPGGG